MSQRTFKLNAPTVAVLSENGQCTSVSIPAHAVISLIVGDINGDGIVKIRYQNRVLTLFADDLRRAKPVISAAAGR